MTSSSSFDVESASLPTLEKLSVSLPTGVDPAAITQAWFGTFSNNVQTGNVDGIPHTILCQLVDDAFWCDILALTCTFYGHNRIEQFLVDRLATTKLSDLQLDATTTSLRRPTPDIACVEAFFTLSTANYCCRVDGMSTAIVGIRNLEHGQNSAVGGASVRILTSGRHTSFFRSQTLENDHFVPYPYSIKVCLGALRRGACPSNRC